MPKTKQQTERQRPEALIDAKAAMALLGVKPQTLYAYVSRGLVRTVSAPAGNASLYFRQDVETLQMRGRSRQAIRTVAERALRIGGAAVLKTSITSIGPEGPRYHGILATELAQTGRPFEDCVDLLWNGMLSPAQSIRWAPQRPPASFRPFARAIAAAAAAQHPRRVFALCTQALALCNGPNAELKVGASVLACRQLMEVMAAACGLLRDPPRFGRMSPGDPLAVRLCRNLGLELTDNHLRAVNAMLIICADHELAPSSFVARIAASTGADIYSCVTSALGAFEGTYTGMGCDQTEEMLRKGKTPASYIQSLKAVALGRQPFPGYNHPVYPGGDPRATFLLDLVPSARPGSKRAALVLACVDAARTKLKASPSLTIGLAAMAIVLDLPPRAAGALMALARTSGWIAHMFEQRQAGFLVRPHAEYIGAVEPDAAIVGATSRAGTKGIAPNVFVAE